jgi:hypothetical protein
MSNAQICGFKAKHFKKVNFCCHLESHGRIVDPGCLSRVSIPDPGSKIFRIPDPHKRRQYFLSQKLFLSSPKYDWGFSSQIRIPNPDLHFLPIPDPRIRELNKVLRIRITLMLIWVQILHVTLMRFRVRIRILLITLLRIRIWLVTLCGSGSGLSI